PLDLMQNRVLREPRGPRLVYQRFDRATLIGPAVVIVAGGHYRANSGEVRRMSDGREHLRRTDVRAAEHADLAVRIRLRGDPLDRVVAVVRFVDERIPIAVGGVAAAYILQKNHISTRSRALREVHGVAPNRPAIRRALQ